MTKESKYIVRAVFDGTKQDYAIRGRSIDSIMSKIRRQRIYRSLNNASVFLFYRRKDMVCIETRCA